MNLGQFVSKHGEVRKPQPNACNEMRLVYSFKFSAQGQII